MKMVWHIFKKDWRLLRWNVGILAAVQCGQALLRWRADKEGQQFEALAMMLQALVWLGGAVLIAAAVHQDSLVGVRQDWLVRPVRRTDLLGAKVLFLFLLVVGPFGLIEFAGGMARGFPWPQSLDSALWVSAYMTVVWYLPALAMAALTKSLTQLIAAAAVGLVLVLAVMNAASGIIRFAGALGSVLSWVATGVGALWVLSGLALVLAIQYRRRATAIARWIALAIGVGWWIILAMPFSTALAVQQRVAPLETGGQISFHPEDNPPYRPEPYSMRHVEVDGEPTREVMVPIRLESLANLAKDEWLQTNQVLVRLVQDGVTMDLPARRYLPPKERLVGPSTLAFDVPERLLAMGVKVRLEADLMATVMHSVANMTLPVTQGWAAMGEFGKCQAGVPELGGGVTALCLQLTGGPAACVEFTLIHAGIGTQNSPMMACHTTYAPWGNRFDDRAIESFQSYIDLRIKNPTARPAEPAAGLQDKALQLEVTAYGIEKQVRLRLVIPEIVLSEWQAK